MTACRLPTIQNTPCRIGEPMDGRLFEALLAMGRAKRERPTNLTTSNPMTPSARGDRHNPRTR